LGLHRLFFDFTDFISWDYTDYFLISPILFFWDFTDYLMISPILMG